MTDVIADAVKQSPGRWQAMIRRLNGDELWTGNRIHSTRRGALIEALKETTRACWMAA